MEEIHLLSEVGGPVEPRMWAHTCFFQELESLSCATRGRKSCEWAQDGDL